MSITVPVITIDGPSGSGKGTVSVLLAQKLGWHFLDSGALYRVLALAAKRHAIELSDVSALETLAHSLDVQFKTIKIGTPSNVFLEGDDVSDIIRSEACGNDASKIAALPGVRAALIDRQRAFRKAPGLVTDGRDMGSVIFPDAQLKIFLMATMEERAKRRYNQLKEGGVNVTLEQVLDELAERDVRDQERDVAPLIPAEGSIKIDTTNSSVNDVLLQILTEVDAKNIATLENA